MNVSGTASQLHDLIKNDADGYERFKGVTFAELVAKVGEVQNSFSPLLRQYCLSNDNTLKTTGFWDNSEAKLTLEFKQLKRAVPLMKKLNSICVSISRTKAELE